LPFFRQNSPPGPARRLPHKRSYSDLIPVGINESSPDPPPVLPKPGGIEGLRANQEPERTSPSLLQQPEGQLGLDAVPTPERPAVPPDAPNNAMDEAQKAKIMKNTHHHHYWIRSSSAPTRRMQPPNQPSRRYSNEASIPVTDIQSNPFIREAPPKLHAELHAELRVPSRSSRHRYIIGTPPKSDAAHVKVISDSFSRRRADWREEHTHIHIYVPPSTAEPEQEGAQCNPARTPIVEERRASESKHESIHCTPTRVQESYATRDREQRQSRTQAIPQRRRRHRRSFQD
jgi:hypothetical protein